MKDKIFKKMTALIATVVLTIGAAGTVSFAALEDGTYKVPVNMKKAVEDSASMGAGALESDALVEVKSGKPEITLYFKGISFMNMYGHIEKLYTYTEGTDLTSTSKSPIEAKVAETFEDEGLDGNKKSFPRSFKFSRENTDETFIPIRVLTDAMANIASDGKGEQDARVMIDYSAAKKTEDKSAPKAETKDTNTTNNSGGTKPSSSTTNSTTPNKSTSTPSSSSTAKSSSNTAKSPETLPKTGSDVNTKNVALMSGSVILAGLVLRRKFK